ncbi:MAG: UvrD-helicase domain-containing protein, partial [bacterium]|nr:UvrD-helicase domain-containing protein [bacterium]
GDSVSLSVQTFLDLIASAKQQILGPKDKLDSIIAGSPCDSSTLSLVYEAYQRLLAQQHLFDYEDLIFTIVKRFETDADLCRKYRDTYKYIFVDEYQDLNHGQYRLVKALAPADKPICVIGDPDQSIYGFRGSDARYFKHFVRDYSDTKAISLSRNYRSTKTILEAAFQVINKLNSDLSRTKVISEIDGSKTVTILETATEKSEAVA